MARSYFRWIVRGAGGRVVQNARVVVSESGVSSATPVTDLFAGASGGSPVTQLLSNAQGEVAGWLDEFRNVRATADDNGDTCYYPSDPTVLKSFTTFFEDPVPVYENPADEDPVLSGTWAEMQAYVSPLVNQTWTATDQFDARYQFNGTRWRLIGLLPGQYAPIERGADPTGLADSRQAILDTIDDATTALGFGPNGGGDGSITGMVLWTPGEYWVEGGDIEHPNGLLMFAYAGQSGQFIWQRVPYIIFETGGFVLANTQSASLTWDGIGVMCQAGTPIRTDDGAGPGSIRNCLLRSLDGVHSAGELNDTFFGNFENNEIRVVQGADIPVLKVRTTSAGGIEGWSFQWNNNRMNGGNGCIEWDIDTSHMKEVGAGTVIRDMVGENMTALAAIVRFRNVHPTNNASIGGIGVEYSYIDDSPGDWNTYVIETLGAGTLSLGVLGSDHTSHGANGFDILCLETGGGIAVADGFVSVGNTAPSISYGTPRGGTAVGMARSFQALNDRMVADGHDPMFEAQIGGENYPRLHMDAGGGTHRHVGSANPVGKVVDRVGSGVPTIDGIGGSRYVDVVTGTRYAKFPGTTGSSGWVSLPLLIEYASATVLGLVVRRVRLYDEAGGLLGYIPVYDTIT